VALHAADTNLVRLPDAVGFVEAAALGCRFATAYRALTAHARLQPGQWLAVHGCGGVGLSAVAIAVAVGARVVAVDLSADALERASRLGAEVVVRSADPVAAVREATGGGAHASVDALGSPATAAASVASLRRRGRHVQVGLLLDPAGTALPMDLVVAHELELYGSHGLAAADYPPMLALVASGAVSLSALVGAVISLDEAPAALMAMDQLSGGTGGLTVVALSG
jgi:alcohol dehydrogenase